MHRYAQGYYIETTVAGLLFVVFLSVCCGLCYQLARFLRTRRSTDKIPLLTLLGRPLSLCAVLTLGVHAIDQSGAYGIFTPPQLRFILLNANYWLFHCYCVWLLEMFRFRSQALNKPFPRASLYVGAFIPFSCHVASNVVCGLALATNDLSLEAKGQFLQQGIVLLYVLLFWVGLVRIHVLFNKHRKTVDTGNRTSHSNTLIFARALRKLYIFGIFKAAVFIVVLYFQIPAVLKALHAVKPGSTAPPADKYTFDPVPWLSWCCLMVFLYFNHDGIPVQQIKRPAQRRVRSPVSIIQVAIDESDSIMSVDINSPRKKGMNNPHPTQTTKVKFENVG